MARSNIIKAIIVADVKNFKDGLAKTGKTMDEFGKTMSRRVSLPLAAAGIAAIKMGSDLAEASSMASQVFGNAADEIVAQSKNITDSFSQEEYLSMAGNLGDIAQGMGFTADASADLSKDVLSLAQDLGSFKNLPTERAVQAITSAMTGEREALKSLGIVVNEEMVKQKALAMGLGATTGALTQQEKATATLALITAASSNAIGDWDRTSDGAAGQAKILQANMKDMAAELGQNLLPVANAVLGWATDLSAAFASLDETTQTVIVSMGALAVAAGPVMRLLGPVATGLGAIGISAGLFAPVAVAGAVALAGVAAALVAVDKWAPRTGNHIGTLSDEMRGQVEIAEQLAGEWGGVGGELSNVGDQLIWTAIQAAGLDDEIIGMGWGMDGLIEKLLAVGDADGATEQVEQFAALKKELGLTGGVGDETSAALWRLAMNVAGSKKIMDDGTEGADDLADGLDGVADASERAADYYSDLVANLNSNLGTQVEVDRLFEEIVGTLGELDEMTLTEIRDEVLDTTDTLAGIMDSASPADVQAMKGRIDEIKYGIALLGQAGELSMTQVDNLLASLDALSRSPVVAPRFNNATGMVGVGATGGIVTRPTLAMIGEAGPEAVVPLNRTPGSSPLPGGMGGGGGTVHVVLEVDGQVLADVVANNQNGLGN